jgi:hypothetical protein
VKLKYLDLDKNAITALDNNVFNSLTGLRELILSNNELKSLNSGLFTSQKNLHKLLLRNNTLTTIDMATVEPLNNFKDLNLNDNPLLCDCNLKDALLIIISRHVEYDATCDTPDLLRGKSWELLQLLPCETTTETATTHTTTTATPATTTTSTTTTTATTTTAVTNTDTTTAGPMSQNLAANLNGRDDMAAYCKPCMNLILLQLILLITCYMFD